jgi:CO/xanthine dehydrogenase FAD-binding subunit
MLKAGRRWTRMPVLTPAALADALDALDRDPSALVLSGGTDLMVEINGGHRAVATTVVSLRRIEELRSVTSAGGWLHMGGGVTFTRLLEADVVAAAPALAHAARTVGSPQIRNAATIAGNIATASPAGDSLPVLVALDAVVTIAGAARRRTVPLTDLIVGPKRTSLGPGELITEVSVPIVRGHQEYRKVGARNAMVIAVASVALVIDLDAFTVRVGLGSVGPVPLRAPEAEGWIADRLAWEQDGARLVDDADAPAFGALVAGAALPIDDHRSTAAYRRHAVGVLATRCLRRATTR